MSAALASVEPSTCWLSRHNRDHLRCIAQMCASSRPGRLESLAQLNRHVQHKALRRRLFTCLATACIATAHQLRLSRIFAKYRGGRIPCFLSARVDEVSTIATPAAAPTSSSSLGAAAATMVFMRVLRKSSYFSRFQVRPLADSASTGGESRQSCAGCWRTI